MSARNALDPDPAKRCGSVSVTLTVEVELGTADEVAFSYCGTYSTHVRFFGPQYVIVEPLTAPVVQGAKEARAVAG
jgi:hypothetical protein